jgi:hypothetical protein
MDVSEPPSGFRTATLSSPLRTQAKWRESAPDYDACRETLPLQRTHHFDPASLEAIVERIVQVFKMKVTHKKDPATWGTFDGEYNGFQPTGERIDMYGVTSLPLPLEPRGVCRVSSAILGPHLAASGNRLLR